jgi:hypothetical protein
MPATAISAAIRPYSIAVAARVSRSNIMKWWIIVVPLWFTVTGIEKQG